MARMRRPDRIRFYGLMRDFVRDGVPLYDALVEIESAPGKLRLMSREILRDLLQAMRGRQGRAPKTFGYAVRAWVEPMEAALIDAGEQSGRLELGLDEAAGLVVTQARIRSTIWGAMLYPVFLLLLLAVFLWLVSSQIVPAMEDISPRTRWPMSGRFMGWLSDHAVAILAGLSTGVSALAGTFMATATRWIGARRDWFDVHVPPWSVYRQIQSSMMLTGISLLVSAGMPMSAVIAQLHGIGTPWQKRHMERIQGRMRRGESESQALASEDSTLFDPITAWEIRIYGARSTFAQSLRGMSTRAIERVEARVRMQFTVLRYVLMVLVATLLGLTYISFLDVAMSGSRGAVG